MVSGASRARAWRCRFARSYFVTVGAESSALDLRTVWVSRPCGKWVGEAGLREAIQSLNPATSYRLLLDFPISEECAALCLAKSPKCIFCCLLCRCPKWSAAGIRNRRGELEVRRA